MSVPVESTTSRVHLPLPVHFSHPEQSFSLKKRRFPLSSSSASNSSSASPVRGSYLPPLPPSKGWSSVSRMFPQHQSPWTPLSDSLCKSPPPSSEYDPSKHKSYFGHYFTNLGLLGRGSFGVVYKVQNKKDGRLYAVKLSAQRFRGVGERKRSVREARNHERVCPHPHILDFVAAWEESGRLFIQTELCSTSLLLYAEDKPPGPDEPAAWGYLCDLLSALHHLHSRGFIHLDLKPANVLITDSGRLKLGDFGLMLDMSQAGDECRNGKAKEDIQEGDPRYMAPELLRGEYGPAADVFSLGVSILELACNLEVPNGGPGWQQLRQGHLPSEFTNGLSVELQSVLRMMLIPEPSERPTVSELLALPSVRKRRWKRRFYLTVAETMLALVSFCQLVACFGCKLLSSVPFPFPPCWSKPEPRTPPKESCDRDATLTLSSMHTDPGSPEDDEGVFLHHTDPELSPTLAHRVKLRLPVESTSTPLPGSPMHNRQSPDHTSLISTQSVLGDWSSCNLTLTPSSIQSNSSCPSPTPDASPIHAEHHPSSSSSASSKRHRRNWVATDKAAPRPNFEPKNLLSLFDETTLEERCASLLDI
ncbi:membrane-associated tyrosine- and threonine-specific cdc2-inhibitory kinase isoform 1-T2 [Fundulus diaphanus]